MELWDEQVYTQNQGKYVSCWVTAGIGKVFGLQLRVAETTSEAILESLCGISFDKSII